MSKKIAVMALLVMMMQLSFGQQYIVSGTTPNLHLSHTVAAKETWYSISRIYNLSPKDMAAYNKLSLSTPLEIGQHIEVPLTVANFSQSGDKAAQETLVPVYHIVQPREWLYRISVNYKVPVALLQKWNNIGKDGAKAGTSLIVGYLTVKDANAALAARAPQAGTEHAAPVKADSPVAVKPAADARSTQPKATATETKPAENKPVNDQPVAKSNESGVKGASLGREGSYFKSLYEDSGKSGSGIAGIFKSTSGWNDGKYYALASNVPVGTIVKITYPSTNKSIYAKVLGELPDMKESAGLALRISDAAAYELGSPDSKFSVSIKY